MKCDKCNRKAEFGWDGEEGIYCADHYNERSKQEELARKQKRSSTMPHKGYIEFEGQR